MSSFKRNEAHIDDDKDLNSRKKHAKEFKEMNAFASLDDSDLMQIASYEPNQKLLKTQKGIFNTLFFALPAADVLITSAAKNTNLSGKISAGIKQAGSWAAVFGVGALVLGGAKRIVNNNVPQLNDADKKYPALSFVTDFALLFASLTGFYKLNKSATRYINKNYSKQVDYFRKSIKAPLKTALNNSAFNKKVVEPLNAKAFKSANGWGRSLKIVEAFLAPVILTATLFKGLNSAKQNKKEAYGNYDILKTTQNMTRIALDSQKLTK